MDVELAALLVIWAFILGLAVSAVALRFLVRRKDAEIKRITDRDIRFRTFIEKQIEQQGLKLVPRFGDQVEPATRLILKDEYGRAAGEINSQREGRNAAR